MEAALKLEGSRAEAGGGVVVDGMQQHLVGFAMSMAQGGEMGAEPGVLGGMSRELREFVLSKFPNGLPTANDARALLDEAKKRRKYPNLDELSQTQCEFVTDKIVAGCCPKGWTWCSIAVPACRPGVIGGWTCWKC